MTKTRNAMQLADLAGCFSPDSPDSPGARFLDSIEADTLEQIADNDGQWDDDMSHEIADGAVPVYTHERWQVFVDLGAYQEDPSEFGSDSSDMTQCAAVCLYMIADRLARAVAVEAVEKYEQDDEGEA